MSEYHAACRSGALVITPGESLGWIKSHSVNCVFSVIGQFLRVGMIADPQSESCGPGLGVISTDFDEISCRGWREGRENTDRSVMIAGRSNGTDVA